MIRREFIMLLGGAVAAWPLAASAQEAAKQPTIGFLGGGTPSSQSQWAIAFAQRLRELVLKPNHNVGNAETVAKARCEWGHRHACIHAFVRSRPTTPQCDDYRRWSTRTEPLHSRF